MIQWYVNLYDKSAERLASGDAPKEGILIDASSNTLTYTGVGVRSDRHKDAMPITLPHVLHWLQPSTKLLLMLREPGSRYYSAYRYYNKRYKIYERYGPNGPAAFGKMVLADVGAFSKCRLNEGNSARRCARIVYHEAEQLVKGMYSLFLEGWLDVFPADQLLVVRLEDYDAQLERHLDLVLKFLGLPPPPDRSTWRRMLSKPRANRQMKGEPMLESTRDVLRTFYAEFNEHLAELLGDKRYREWHEGLDNEVDAPMGVRREASVYGVVG